MKTTYHVVSATQGINEKEIAKAKRIYRNGVANGLYPKVGHLLLLFSDRNNFDSVNFLITAVQLTTENTYDVMTWANHIQPADKQMKMCIENGVIRGFMIPTKEGDMLCGIGDYLIREPFPTDDRMFYPCKADMFGLTYDEIA